MPSISTPHEYVDHLKRQGFVLGDVLGQGLSGTVYAAKQTSLNRMVAVKFFDSAFVRDDEAMGKRFSREAKLLAKFQHQCVPYVLTEGVVHASHGNSPYFVMEYVQGKTLREILDAGSTLDPALCIEYALQIIDALGYAHAREILHRDVKPANIMIDQRGRCFLIDFSIGVSTQHESGLTRATASGETLGTTAYMSPEQFRDTSKVDGRSDIYAMGVVLFEMLTGRTDRTNIQKALMGHSRGIVEGIETACAADPEKRFQTAEEFARALGGTRQILAPALNPALAICTNLECSGANWSQRGYYRGPNVVENSTTSFCTSCGEQLRYQCEGCGVSITNTPHCGNCGAKTFAIPECVRCKSLLTREFINADTTKGCSKCIGKPVAGTIASITDIEDDIPF